MAFNYTVKAHPTMYNGVQYRSRLEARWAAFFDLIGWQHEYEPIDLPGWSPDFRVVFPCGHSECSGSHSLLVEVKPFFELKQFKGHPCMNYAYGAGIPADASAAFGANPEVTQWEMGHGAGGGVFDLLFWIDGLPYSRLWSQAGNAVQWIPVNTVTSLPDFSSILPDESKQFEKTYGIEALNIIKAHRAKNKRNHR
jgi:hypothetical protein